MRRTAMAFLTTIVAPCLMIACSLADLVKVSDPEGQSALDRDFVQGPQGAVGLFYASLGLLQQVVSDRALEVGLFTDELTSRPEGTQEYSEFFARSDSRTQLVQSKEYYRIDGSPHPVYTRLQTVRLNAIQARRLLKNLKDDSFNADIAGTYAVEAYAILMLAEDLCSGVPLSEISAEGEAVYGGPLTTNELFRIAVAKFDSSLRISHDSAKYVTLAKIGKGRALIGMGEYKSAADAVMGINALDKFEFKYTNSTITNSRTGEASQPFRYWTGISSGEGGGGTAATEIVNQEGGNGMVWYVNPLGLDPRIPVTTETVDNITRFTVVVRQRKYVGSALSFPLAKWAEVKMIEAESYLKDGDDRWIDPINEARRSVGLSDTLSPANIDQKINLLFRERAYWFYGEGVRLADYRRLVRQYHRSPYTVYPTGGYSRSNSLTTVYGAPLVYVPHIDEYVYNHKYNGCLHENP